MTPELSSAIRSMLIALGTFGIAKGWYDAAQLDSIVGYIIGFGGAGMTLGAAVWGVYAKRPRSAEAQQVSANVVAAPAVAAAEEAAKEPAKP